jgi:PPOX class probable F420-dependent enzyme
MQPDEARGFLRVNHRAVLATARADGRPQLSPVSCGVDGAGRVIISTRETAVKTRNLRRNPLASLCVFTDAFFGPWVQVEGKAEIISLPGAMESLVEYYRLISGEHAD